MTNSIIETRRQSTSAYGDMRAAAWWLDHLYSGTNTGGVTIVSSHDVMVLLATEAETTPSPPLVVASAQARTASIAAAIMEIRRISGLTWDELASLFRVSRRTLHHWASGKPASAEHEQRAHRLVGTLRQIDRGEAPLTRALLLEPAAGGVLAIDLLRHGNFDDVLAMAGYGAPRQQLLLTPLAPAAVALRRPPAPVDLLNALSDRVCGVWPSIDTQDAQAAEKEAVK